MLKYSLIISCFLLILNVKSYGQKEDHHWLIGIDIEPEIEDTIFGNTSFNFNYDPVKIYYQTKHKINMAGGNATLCDKEGNLALYSNGQILMDEDNQFIEDTINYDHNLLSHCMEWENDNRGNENKPKLTGLFLFQRVLLLPVKEKIMVVYNTSTYCQDKHIYRVVTSLIDTDTLNSIKRILIKDSIVYNIDTLISSLHAVRHGNGKDWWVVTFTRGYEYMVSFLVTENGVNYHDKVKTGNIKMNNTNLTDGQITFSPDGRQIVLYTSNRFNHIAGGGFCVWDFNRCDGTISNLRNVVSSQPSLEFGAAFSHDSKYIYISNGTHIKQYDPYSAKYKLDEKTVAVYDSFYYEVPGPNPNNIKFWVSFGQLKLGPDGRIYIYPHSATNQYLSVMNYPHENYKKTDVRQHSIFTPRIFTRTVPNIPEFRLGPDDGSPCDTLGLDNHPVAKFRYEPDSSDYKRIRFTDLSYFRAETWSWDFGDGSPRVTERYPFHTYAQNGTYEVCLTVSNENSSNTTCRTVTIGTSSSEDAGKKADITLFPNPVADILLVTLGEYIPQHGIIHIADATGRKVISQRIYYGHNHIDMMSLPAGLYFWTVEDGGVVLKGGKVVKI